MGFSRIAIIACLGLEIFGCKPKDAPTVVSLEFDDVHIDQLAALPLLAKHEMKATFFLNEPRLEEGGNYFTVADALAMQKAGHEMGGHTLTHPRLTDLSREEQIKEVCEDRERLRQRGFVVDNFAYPSGAHNLLSELVVFQCGYQSARTSGGLCENPGVFDFCDRAETIPPVNFFVTRTHASIKRERIPYRIRHLITDAYEHGGGWVQIIFHHVCEYCDDYSITATELDEFLTWLDNERGAGRVRVQTVREVIRGEGAK